MRCNNCGAENPNSKKFCGDCGAPLVQPESQPFEELPAVDWGRRKFVFIAIPLGLLLICLCLLVVIPKPSGQTTSYINTPKPIAVAAKGTVSLTNTPTFAIAPTKITTPTIVAPPTPTALPTSTPTLSGTSTVTSTPTDTRIPSVTSTATPKPSPTPTLDVASDKQTYQAIDVRELKKSPDKFRGQKIALSGEVFRISETKTGTEMQIWVNQPGGSSFDRIDVYIKYPGTLPGLYEKDDVIVYGEGSGTFAGMNLMGGFASSPLVSAKYVDYGESLPALPPIAKNVLTNFDGKWELTFVGDFRDKVVFSVFGGDSNKVAMGVWATAQFRVRNLQAGSDSFGKHHDFVAIAEDGAIYKDDFGATLNATWQYCGCETISKQLGPGQDTVFVISFDVPEATQTLIFAPTTDASSSKPVAGPRFLSANFDQIPAWKPKK